MRSTFAAQNLAALPELGTKFHTRGSTVNPANRTQAETGFANGQNVAGYGCASPDAFVTINNSGTFGPPNNTNNIATFVEVFFEVTAGQAGVWEFRYGADFGLGGGLHVDDVALEEDWNNDLWWNNNWNTASEVLQGSINLGVGIHSLRILGFEDCCDGGLTAQFRRRGGPWQDLTTTNVPLRARHRTVAGQRGRRTVFSNNGGATYNYTPVPNVDGIDPAVTHFRMEASNPFAGNGGSGYTSVRFLFKTRIR